VINAASPYSPPVRLSFISAPLIAALLTRALPTPSSESLGQNRHSPIQTPHFNISIIFWKFNKKINIFNYFKADGGQRHLASPSVKTATFPFKRHIFKFEYLYPEKRGGEGIHAHQS